MKYCLFFVALFSAAFVFTAKAQDSYLLPEKFMLKKGDTLKVHLIQGNEFKEDYELKYASSATKQFMLNEGGKKINLATVAKDSIAPIVRQVLTNPGLGLIEMTSSPEPIQMERELYAKFLSDQGLAKLADQVNNSNQSQFREKSTRYLKTLVMIDKPTGGDFDKPTGQELEIVLKKSPYKSNYGEDLTAVVFYKGKPAKAMNVDLYIRTQSGNIYPQNLSTDADGQINITLSREGLYMLRTIKTEAANSNDFDFVTTQAAYVFRFSSQNDMPNDYHSTGLRTKNQ